MQEASDLFMAHVTTLLSQTRNFSEQLLDLRKLFEAANIPNKIADGTVPFPENQQSIRDGISLEFRYVVLRPQFLQIVYVDDLLRNVAFKYPGSEKYALRDISFRVEQGQLCAIIYALLSEARGELMCHFPHRSFLVPTDQEKAPFSNLWLDYMTPQRDPSSSTDRTSSHCGWKIFVAQWQSCSRIIPSFPSL